MSEPADTSVAAGQEAVVPLPSPSPRPSHVAVNFIDSLQSGIISILQASLAEQMQSLHSKLTDDLTLTIRQEVSAVVNTVVSEQVKKQILESHLLTSEEAAKLSVANQPKKQQESSPDMAAVESLCEEIVDEKMREKMANVATKEVTDKIAGRLDEVEKRMIEDLLFDCEDPTERSAPAPTMESMKEEEEVEKKKRKEEPAVMVMEEEVDKPKTPVVKAPELVAPKPATPALLDEAENVEAKAEVETAKPEAELPAGEEEASNEEVITLPEQPKPEPAPEPDAKAEPEQEKLEHDNTIHKEHIRKKFFKWLHSMQKNREESTSLDFDAYKAEGHSRMSMFTKIAKVALASHKSMLSEAAKGVPGSTDLALLPSRADVNQKQKAFQALERKFSSFVDATNERLDKLEQMFKSSDLAAIDRTIEQSDSRDEATPPLTLMKKMANKMITLEKASNRTETVLKASDEKMQQIQKIAAESAGATRSMLAAAHQDKGIDAETLEASIQFKIDEMHAQVQSETKDVADQLSSDLENAVSMMKEDTKVIFDKLGEMSATPVDSFGEMAEIAHKWIKSLAESLKLVEKKQGGIEIFANQRGAMLYDDFVKLQASAAAALQCLGDDAISAADQMRKRGGAGKEMIRLVTELAVALNIFLNENELETEDKLVDQVFTRLTYKKPPLGAPPNEKERMTVKNMKDGLSQALDELARFLRMPAVASALAAGIGLQTLTAQVKKKTSLKESMNVFATMEYSQALQDALSTQILGAQEEVKNFERSFTTMITEIQQGQDTREALSKMSSGLDEMKIKMSKKLCFSHPHTSVR
jgi:hypothetical protein